MKSKDYSIALKWWRTCTGEYQHELCKAYFPKYTHEMVSKSPQKIQFMYEKEQVKPIKY